MLGLDERSSISSDTGFADIRTALAHLKAGRDAEAVRMLTSITRQEQLPAHYWMELGMCLRRKGSLHAALGCYQAAAEAGIEQDALFMTRMANIHADLDHLNRAISFSSKALQKANNGTIRANHAKILRAHKEFQQAYDMFSTLVEEEPGNKDYHWEKAFTRMYLGLDRSAWKGFQVRFDVDKIPSPPAADYLPRWQGEPLAGKRLLLTHEQGFGDTILMLRYVHILKEMGATVILECQPELNRLVEGLPLDGIVKRGTQRDIQADYYCPLMSLPAFLWQDDSPPPPPARLTVPEGAKKDSRKLFLFPEDHKLNVGIVWSGSKTFADNRRRSVDVDRFLDLAILHNDCRFFSLQKGPGTQDLYRTGGQFLIRDAGPGLRDFADTAALIERLDIIVMTDSSVAHLAGSLGKPVLNLLNYNPYWLYFPDGPETLWYPSMFLLRQDSPGNWDGVFQNASNILSHLARTKSTLGRRISAAQVEQSLQTYMSALEKGEPPIVSRTDITADMTRMDPQQVSRKVTPTSCLESVSWDFFPV
ncbi:tetratricopeptide repeat protein [Aestuariispira insulae]|uniref:Tetratricopeptide repeat protein n=1 Tax=Aestuariispira insulae TaxID=1461337 RepID=A0A3D9H1H2_9PROT|nr:tetratricopeptide repeat protein [Aestuariispira insulae]RED43352.1 hypothetical protein DFP90_12410 [Aestuariispira insulae]